MSHYEETDALTFFSHIMGTRLHDASADNREHVARFGRVRKGVFYPSGKIVTERFFDKDVTTFYIFV